MIIVILLNINMTNLKSAIFSQQNLLYLQQLAKTLESISSKWNQLLFGNAIIIVRFLIKQILIQLIKREKNDLITPFVKM